MAEMEKRINALIKELETLPKGNITYKTIRGAKRMYLDGKYVKAVDEVDALARVDRRNKIKMELKNLLSGQPSEESRGVSEAEYLTNVISGERLQSYVDSVKNYKHRECFERLEAFLDSEIMGKVCLLYGLRRTGKTILLFQAIATCDLDKSAYIKIMSSNDMSMLNNDLRNLSARGIKYVFIDEVTLMNDFIDSASLLSDVYAMSGMKIVLAGTDSLGLVFSSDEELYDRTVTIHTTFIPFREYSSLLGIHDIDEYIRYGGTFRVGETDFDDPEFEDEGISFRDDESTRRYIDTAIARNIQHSLACYKGGVHFRHLIELYEADEFTNAVNRIIEDMNHRFLLSVLGEEFDEEITADYISEIKECLKLLDLIIDCPVETIGSSPSENVLFSQPGMRYCQAQALVYSIMKDEAFDKFSIIEKNEFCNIILEEVKGRMLEEIVLLETKKVLPRGKRAFKLIFAVGEFDMVIADEKELTCEIFEIKHTENIFEGQYKNLIDEEKCRLTEHKYGTITKKAVLYRGEDTVVNGIHYVNVTEYLEKLS